MLGDPLPREVDAFLTKESCVHAMQESRDLLAQSLAQHENSELRKVRFSGCDAVFIPAQLPEVF